MKILYLHGNSFTKRKANNLQVFNMCQAFSELGLEVVLGIPKSFDDGLHPFEHISQQLGESPLFNIITYKKFVLAGRFQMLGNYFGAKSLIRNIKTDLCFVRDPLLLKIAFDAHYPILFEVHTADFHDRNKFLSKRWENYVIKISKKSRVIRLITISNALKEFWCNKGVPETKLLAAHDGFSHRLFKEEKGTKETRALLGLPANQKIVIYVGSLYPNRGIERIISLAQYFPEVLFLVIGGPDEQKQYYQDLSNKSYVKNIIWKGFLPHSVVPNYLMAANVLLLLFTWDVPTIYFCSPLKVFEYMAAGKPIVGEAFPTITEVLKHKYTAYLAKPGDFEDLSKNLKIALSDDGSSKMGMLAREDAFLKYTWTNRAKKILSGIDELIY